MPLQVDIDFERPLARYLASSAAHKQQHDGRQQQDKQPSDKRQDALPAALASPDATTENHPGPPFPSLSAQQLFQPLGHASSASSECNLRMIDLVLGCIRRVVSSGFKQSLLQCQAGDHAAVLRLCPCCSAALLCTDYRSMAYCLAIIDADLGFVFWSLRTNST